MFPFLLTFIASAFTSLVVSISERRFIILTAVVNRMKRSSVSSASSQFELTSREGFLLRCFLSESIHCEASWHESETTLKFFAIELQNFRMRDQQLTYSRRWNCSKRINEFSFDSTLRQWRYAHIRKTSRIAISKQRSNSQRSTWIK